MTRPFPSRAIGFLLCVAALLFSGGVRTLPAAVPAAPLLRGQSSVLTLGPGEALAFDYSDTDLSTAAVTGFEAQYDGGAWQPLTTSPFRDAITLPGHTSYRFSPPFSNGNHAVAVRACNVFTCGGSSAAVPFAYGVAPGATPGNFRKVSAAP